MRKSPIKIVYLTLILIGVILATYAYCFPTVIRSRDFAQHTETLLSEKKKVNARKVEFLSLAIPHNGTLTVQWTSDEAISFYITDLENFERFAQKQFHGYPRETISSVLDSKDYTFSFEPAEDRVWLIFDNGQGDKNAHLKLTVTLAWSETVTSEQKQYPMIGWVGLITIAVGVSNLTLLQTLRKKKKGGDKA